MADTFIHRSYIIDSIDFCFFFLFGVAIPIIPDCKGFCNEAPVMFAEFSQVLWQKFKIIIPIGTLPTFTVPLRLCSSYVTPIVHNHPVPIAVFTVLIYPLVKPDCQGLADNSPAKHAELGHFPRHAFKIATFPISSLITPLDESLPDYSPIISSSIRNSDWHTLSVSPRPVSPCEIPFCQRFSNQAPIVHNKIIALKNICLLSVPLSVVPPFEIPFGQDFSNKVLTILSIPR
jgi:hypothetical protein